MQLPFLKGKDQEKIFFLSLLIKPYKVGAILFEEINSKLFILSTNEVETDRSTSEISPEELLNFSDKAISSVEESLPQGASLEKTIFSVPYTWIEEGKIKREHLSKLKKICEDLGLVPIGYLASIEAIIHFLQKTEGAPISAIFIEHAASSVIIYLVRAGKILEVHSSDEQKNILETIETLLKRIEKVEVLPSKIIILDYKDEDAIQQQLLSYQWPKDIPFLHLPQVILLEKGFENEATINGVAAQMELEVLQEEHKENDDTQAISASLEETNATELGFIKEQDIATQKIDIEPDVEKPIKIDADDNKLDYEEVTSKATVKKKNDLSIFLVSKLPSIAKKIKIPNIFPSGVPANLLTNTIKTKAIIAAVVILISLLAISFSYYNFILRADIVIAADKKALARDVGVIFAQGANGKNSINVELTEGEVKGNDSRNSTGKKETGEKARGTVTIYSSLPREQTFSKGTTITSATTKREFTLNENVKVASSSGVTDVKTAKVQVTASEIGKEFNLPSGTKFTVATFDSSEIESKNDSAFSGGTKKEVTVVSQDDLDELVESLVKKLEKDALSKVDSGVADNEGIFPKAFSYEIVERDFNKKEGDEAGSVGITATIKYSIGRYLKEDLRKVAETLSRGEIPGTYVIREGDSTVNISDIKVNQKDKSAAAVLKVNAVYSPKIDDQKLAQALKGKSEAYANEQIRSIAGVKDVVINFRNRLPLLPRVLPNNSKNITIEIES